MAGGREKQKKARHYIRIEARGSIIWTEIATASDRFYSSQYLICIGYSTLLLLYFYSTTSFGLRYAYQEEYMLVFLLVLAQIWLTAPACILYKLAASLP